VVPIARCDAEYLRPVSCGDKLEVSVKAKALSDNSYEVTYEVTRLGPQAKRAARARTEHVCIDSKTRARRALPGPLADWVREG
jgi:1,4-dihydroxy-2-naphthoyl-CoA hydrolase